MRPLAKIGDVTKTGRSGAGSSVEWRIPYVLSLSGDTGEWYSSPDFYSCGGMWRLRIFPKGMSPFASYETVCLCLVRRDYGPPLTLNITIGILGAEGMQKKSGRWQEFSTEGSECFLYALCSRTELKQEESMLMPGGMLVLALELKSDKPSKGVEELKICLHKLLSEAEDCDVRINVQGKEFPAHRAILRARSPVFQAMFSHDMVERQSGVVAMEDCDPESFPAFLEHIYTGSTEVISGENVFSLFTAAEKYDLITLKEACTKFIKSNLNVTCVCDVIILAVKYNEKDLIEYTTEYFSSNASEVLKTVEWQIFLKENMTVGNELLIKAFTKLEKKN